MISEEVKEQINELIRKHKHELANELTPFVAKPYDLEIEVTADGLGDLQNAGNAVIMVMVREPQGDES